MITGASIANYIQLFWKRHPAARRPLINYDLALIVQPTSLGGTILGVLFNQIFPDWLVLVLLIVTLVATVVRTAQKAIALHQAEEKVHHPQISP